MEGATAEAALAGFTCILNHERHGGATYYFCG
jgi:hypothetical protein